MSIKTFIAKFSDSQIRNIYKGVRREVCLEQGIEAGEFDEDIKLYILTQLPAQKRESVAFGWAVYLEVCPARATEAKQNEIKQWFKQLALA